MFTKTGDIPHHEMFLCVGCPSQPNNTTNANSDVAHEKTLIDASMKFLEINNAEIKAFIEDCNINLTEQQPTISYPYISPPMGMGVDKELTEVCATICHRMYDDDLSIHLELLFDAKATAKFLVVDDHGVFKNAFPRFAIVSYKNSLIIGWRGLMSVSDWASTFAYSPVTSSLWYDIAPNLRVHSSYSAFVESDLAIYEVEIMKAFQENKNIDEIIFTGHSIGGGMANIAHIIVKSQLEQKGTVWNKAFPNNLTCRTVAFAAPMTTLSTESGLKGIFDPETPTNTFLRKVSDNTCNFVYSFDPVPHAMGDLDYLTQTFKNVFPDLKKSVIEALLLDFPHLKILSKQINYHHIGNIIYCDEKHNFHILRDSPLVDKNLPEFRNSEIIKSTPKSIDEIKYDHMFFPIAFVNQTYRSGSKIVEPTTGNQ